ncbi:transposase [Cohnella lupini]|uniref:Transposase-like zinc ribbon protein n=1 Tax=Cohnella lupini TaxID=1294267 RepID=A0A3D9IV08_9BACL|nr:transposase [Cohnella lupini]RED65610.1 transposase-like zinc ribbon protein [Cohnella lupini]
MRAMSVGKFMARFPDEQACRDYIYQIRWPSGFICTKCSANAIDKLISFGVSTVYTIHEYRLIRYTAS